MAGAASRTISTPTRGWTAPPAAQRSRRRASDGGATPGGAATRILVVDDNAHFAITLRNNLELEGFGVDIATDPADAMHVVRQIRPALVLLDVPNPGARGYDLLAAMRGAGLETPVVLLSGRRDDLETQRAFSLGADDYIAKPIALPELMARIRAVLRRTHPAGAHATHWMRLGELEVHAPTRSVRRNGHPVSLRPKEFDLLLTLLRHRGRVVSRSELLRDVWGYDAETVSRTVDTHMGTLRQKLEPDPLNPQYLLTVRSAGYTLRWPEA
jgi:DNA-binding response OmpR family regulator